MIHLLGIRHHGPGSARNVKDYLERLRPDIVLIEGPPEANEILQWAGHSDLKPPIAILCFQPDDPKSSVFYPFAEFSPEWQAISFANSHKIPVQFIDLPVVNKMALREKSEQTADTAAVAIEENETLISEETVKYKTDPVSFLANAAGYSDTDYWWNSTFEQRINNEEFFTAINEAMQALREENPIPIEREEALREAYMRKMIRQAEKEMYTEIAVICGAWHVPALQNMPSAKQDNDLLKGLPKVKVECTWIPWTYNRLGYFSGYGAGILSPGWYEHLWLHPQDDGTRWMAKVAKLFREKQMDTSVAHVIESVRLAESLASLRGLPKAGLHEMNEAIQTVLCNGESLLLALVNDELIISDKIGEVPTEIPKPPLQLDIEKLQKRLRLPATADWKDFTLDLRKETDLERSVLLHRLRLLGIGWGQQGHASGKGTFKEQWRLQWQPEFSIEIIEKGRWGNTVEEVCGAFVIDQTQKANTLKVLSNLLSDAIPAELPLAIEVLIRQINNIAAASGDVLEMMRAIPDLVSISRYGNVRKTDATLVTNIIESIITRICVSLPSASTSIDEEAAGVLMGLLEKMDESVRLIQIPGITEIWQEALRQMASNKNSSPLIGGYSTRLLADHGLIVGEELAQQFHLGMSTASSPSLAAAWLEGFLKGSGTMLLLNNDLWQVLSHWVTQLGEETFEELLPLLRRSFSNFSPSERRKLGEKVKQGENNKPLIKTALTVDAERGSKGIDIVMKWMGY